MGRLILGNKDNMTPKETSPVVSESIIQEKIVYIDKPIEIVVEKVVLVDKIVEVEKIVTVEKIVEIPKIIVREVEKLVEVEKIVVKEVERLVEVIKQLPPVEITKLVIRHKLARWSVIVMLTQALIIVALLAA